MSEVTSIDGNANANLERTDTWVTRSLARDNRDTTRVKHTKVGSTTNANPKNKLMATNKSKVKSKSKVKDMTMAVEKSMVKNKSVVENFVSRGNQAGICVEEPGLGACDETWEVCDCETLATQAQDEQDKVEWILFGKTESETARNIKR